MKAEIEYDRYKKSGDIHWQWYEKKTGNYGTANKIRDWVQERRILDVGGGDGLVASLLKEQGKYVKVIDVSKHGVMWARKHGLLAQVCSAYDVSPEKVGTFDAAILIDVIEHLQYPEKAVKAIATVTNRLYITTPIRRHDTPRNKYHVREFKGDELVAFMKDNGWNVAMIHPNAPRKLIYKFKWT